MNTYLKILCVFGFMLFYKVNAQLDTLQILKKIEANQKHYKNRSFSKLLKDLKKLTPKKYYTTYSCVYFTQFFFSDDHFNKNLGKYKITVTWKYSNIYENEYLDNIDDIKNFNEKAKDEYKKHHCSYL